VVNEDDANLWYSGASTEDDWPEGFHCENPVAAELDRLRREADEADTLIAKQRELLTGVANALRGEPDPLRSHSHHDLPERALKMREQVARMPVCVGYMSRNEFDLMTQYLRRMTVREATLIFCHPIYIDPPEEKGDGCND
jgi:hypothetical protein